MFIKVNFLLLEEITYSHILAVGANVVKNIKEKIAVEDFNLRLSVFHLKL